MPVRTLAELRNVPRPPWIWEGFIAPRNFTLFSAYPKVGKTTLLFHMLRSLCNGHGFLDRDTRPVPILYISEESDILLAQRAVALEFHDDWRIGWLTKEPGLDWDAVLTYMRRWVHLYGNPLFIVDTLSRFWGVSDENNAAMVDRAINPVLEIIRTSDAAFMGIHHNRKQGGGGGMAVRGSTALTGGVDIIMELTRINMADTSNVRRLNMESRHGETPNILQLRLLEDGYVAEDEEILMLEPRIIAVLQTMECTVQELTFLLEEGDATIRRALTSLYTRGVIHRQGTGGGNSPYRYYLPVGD